MKTVITGTTVVLSELGSKQLATQNFWLAFITIPSIFVLLAMIFTDNADAGFLYLLIGALFALIFPALQIKMIKMYQVAKRSKCEINKETRMIRMKYGDKKIIEDLGMLKHFFIQEVNFYRRRKLWCVYIVGSKKKLYLHECQSTFSKAKKQVESAASFLRVDIIGSENVVGLLEFNRNDDET